MLVGSNHNFLAQADPAFSANLPPASPTAKPTLPPIIAAPMPVEQAILVLTDDIDTLRKQVIALQAQNTNLQGQVVALQAQLTAQQMQLATVNGVVAAISKSLQPTPQPPGTLIGPGVVTWSNLKNGGSGYDNLLIPFYQNPGQQFSTPGYAPSQMPSLFEHRLPPPSPSANP